MAVDCSRATNALCLRRSRALRRPPLRPRRVLRAYCLPPRRLVRREADFLLDLEARALRPFEEDFFLPKTASGTLNEQIITKMKDKRMNLRDLGV